MNKAWIALIGTVILGVTAFSPAADAGFKVRLGFGGPLPVFTGHGHSHGGYEHRRYERERYIARRAARSEERVSRKAAHKTAKTQKSVSKAQTAARVSDDDNTPAKVAEIENSSITTDLADPIETAVIPEPHVSSTPQPAVATVSPKAALTASKADCRKFFPSVGMTLSVPCE